MANGIKTRQELIRRAIDMLAPAAGQAPSAEDVELVDGLLEPMLAMLPARGISEQINPDEVPDEIYLPLAILLADVATTDFGMDRGTPDNPNSFAFKAAEAERMIRVIQGTRPTYNPAQVDYF